VSEKLRQRGRVNALQRHRRPDDPELAAARVELKVISAEEYIKRLVAEAPPLTAEQRDKLAGILRPAAS
jgi:hypothetical protein